MIRSDKISVGIIGAAGLSAGRLLSILSRHPGVDIRICVSESSPGQPVASAHPELRGRVDLAFDAMNYDKLAECDVVFSCKRAGDTFGFIQSILATKSRFIDLSGDYRLESGEAYEQWYGAAHQHPELLKNRKAVYGLPEFYRTEIASAKLIANPGCYTTTSILACAPFVAAGYGTEGPLIIDAISGVSGAGRNPKPENQFLSVADNIRAYRIGNHQHTPEIEQELTEASRRARNNGHIRPESPAPKILFVPRVGPYKAGIMADCYMRVSEDQAMISTEEACALLADTYRGEPFVRISEPGRLPQMDHVVGTNFCDIGVVADARTRTLIAVSVTDNLIKGAAGQAVQNMNIMFDFDERTALL